MSVAYAGKARIKCLADSLRNAGEEPLRLKSQSGGFARLPSGRELYYRYDGPTGRTSRPETFVLIHGLGDNLESWARVANYLREQGFGVLRFDMNGHGRSMERLNEKGARPPAVLPYQRQVEDVVALLQKLGLPNVHLVGHSYGAGIASVVASRANAKGVIEGGVRPVHIKSVHLVAPYVYRLDRYNQDLWAEKIPGFDTARSFWNNVLGEEKIDRLQRPLTNQIMYQRQRARFLREMRKTWGELTPVEKKNLDLKIRYTLAAANGIFPLDARVAVRRISPRVPVGVMAAAQDTTLPVELVAQLDSAARTRPWNFPFLKIEDAGHWIHEDGFDELTRTLVRNARSTGNRNNRR